MAVEPRVRLDPAELRERVARLPRLTGFVLGPTPLEEMPRLSEALGGPRILVKRDDLTGLAFGGNKVRAIEFRMADVRAKGCDAFVLVNVAQSNHARLHAAACTRLGLKMVIVKPGPKGEAPQGNLLLDRMLGVEIVETGTTDPDALNRILDEVMEDLRRRGHKPYAHTREPFSRLAGTVGFAESAIELKQQLDERGLRADHIFMVGGTSSAGLGLGGKLLGAGWHVDAVSVGGSKERLLEDQVRLSNRVADLLGLPPVTDESDFTAYDEYVGERYADAPPATLEAIRLAARTDAIFLDPVYTGKAFSGLIGEIRKGRLTKDQTAVFVHTGGLPIIFAYPELLANLPD
jgi:1-aminocyclopropane-1-carboxylate deaminase/D-cysteine desulfhydrase-like pyridoxal-dependent ACC family enzyme